VQILNEATADRIGRVKHQQHAAIQCVALAVFRLFAISFAVSYEQKRVVTCLNNNLYMAIISAMVKRAVVPQKYVNEVNKKELTESVSYPTSNAAPRVLTQKLSLPVIQILQLVSLVRFRFKCISL
jgi:hypothetical protein